MSFWDASALVPVFVTESRSGELRDIWNSDSSPAVWWATLVECHSALARLGRMQLSPEDMREAEDALRNLALGWIEVPSGLSVRQSAIELLYRHPLRAADALQLSAAIEVRPGAAQTSFVCLDDRLRAAAEAEGFTVLP